MRPWRSLGSRLLLALTVISLLTLVAPPPLLAQGDGRVPARPGGPIHGETDKVGRPGALTGKVRVMIELMDEPAVVSATRSVGSRPGQPSASGFATQAARVDGAQRSTLQALNSSGIRTQVMYRLQKAYNGIATVVDGADVDRIRSQPGVKSVQVLRPMERNNTATVPLVNAPAAWTTAPGFTGQGMKIGIIDTGVDYIHRNFGGSGNYGLNTDETAVGDSPDFPSAVVAGGYDFAGDDYDASSSNPAFFIPHPDPDPIDCNGHGSHVAGTAAGRGVTTGGATFAGPYDGSGLGSLKVGPGVAPAATIYALRVFGCDGSTDLVPLALDWALDPDDNGDFTDRLDVVNMSLGSDFGSPEDPSVVAANNAALAGLIVVASSGNAGDTTAITGTPASGTRVISVAASDDSTSRLDAFQVTAPGPAVGTHVASASVEFNWSGMGAPVSAAVDYAGAAVSGCSSFSAGQFTGEIAMIEWIPSGATSSPCGSATRTNNAQAAGAVGVIFLYDQPVLDISIAGNTTRPAVITTSTVATTLRANQAGLTATLDKALLKSQSVVDAAQEDKISGFTSRGPATRTGALKPDISAPGVTIFSTENGTGTEGFSNSGTSMASPHVAGAMAILKQQHPTWTVEELKALAMNTAGHDVFSGVSHGLPIVETPRMGAGRLDLATAVSSPLIAYVTDEPGLVSVSFGAVESLGLTSLTRTVLIANKGGSPASGLISYSPISQVAGATISFPDGTGFSVPAGLSQTFRVQLNLNGDQLKNPRGPSMAAAQVGLARQYLAELSGLVVVDPTSGPSLRVPLYAAVRPASDMHASQSSLTATSSPQTFSLGLSGTGVNNGASPSVDIRSVVSAFELQAISPARPSSATAEQKAGDLRYVGVASDGRALGTVTGASLYFGLATEHNWLRPSEEVQFSVLIDTNRDGTFDYELYNTEFVDGNGDGTDVVVTGVYNIAGNTTTAPTYLNIFDSTVPTAIFDNNVLILSAPVASLSGLTDASSRFNYKVNVYYNGVIRDSTALLTYDVLRAGADLFTAPGQTPLFFDLPSSSVPVSFNSTNFQANGSLGLLLLHHYNRDGQRAEVVTFSQTQTVSFASGSPVSKTLGDQPFQVSATASSGLPVTISSQTPAVCTLSPTNVVTVLTPGLCTLRATQAGNALFQPATADLAISVSPAPTVPTPPTPPTPPPPSPTECSPRPNVVVSTTRLAPGQLQVTVTAGRGSLQSIRFGLDTRALQNATVQIGSGSASRQITAATTVSLGEGVTSTTFTATRVAAGQPMNVPMVVMDGCGAWETFVGVGANG